MAWREWLASFLRLPRLDRNMVAVIPIDMIGLLALLLTTRLAAEQLGADDFGEFQVVRRTSSVVAGLSALGLAVALPRALPTRGPESTVASLAMGAIITVLLMSGVATVGLLAIDLGFSPLGLPLPLLIAVATMGSASALLAAAQGLERGLLSVRTGNLLALVPTFVPLVVVLVWARDAAQLAVTIGLVMATISAVSLLARVRPWPTVAATLSSMRKLTGIGAPRVIGDVALFALLAIPAWHLAANGRLAEAGVITVPMMLLQAAASGLSSLGAYLLPHVARATGRHEFSIVKRTVERSVIIAVTAATVVMIATFTAFDYITTIIVGDELSVVAGESRWIILAMPGWMMFSLVRHALEPMSDVPVVTIIVVLGVGAILVSIATIPATLTAMSIATAAALSGLGIGSYSAWLVLSQRRITGAGV